MITAPLVITADSLLEAWTRAATLLLEQGDRFNLTIHITNPASIDEAHVAARCHRRVMPGIHKSVYDVANTIFPATSALHSGDLEQFFAYYYKIYARGQRRHRTAWGTYFLRLIAFGTKKDNQLQKIINALVEWNSRPRAAFVLHLSSPELDNPRTMGAPCWQYAQFIRSADGELSMSAVYRSLALQ